MVSSVTLTTAGCCSSGMLIMDFAGALAGACFPAQADAQVSCLRGSLPTETREANANQPAVGCTSAPRRREAAAGGEAGGAALGL